MIIYDRNGITVEFSEEKLKVTTAVLCAAVHQQEGILTAGERKWQFQQPEPILSVRVTETDNNGRSAPYVCLTLETASAAENWTLYPDLPFICTDRHPDGRIFRLPGRHIQITSVELVDKTDHHDSLVKTDVHSFYKRYNGRGNLFLLEDLDGVGIRELVIGAIRDAEEAPLIFEVWTLRREEPEPVLLAGEGERYFLLEGAPGVFAREAEGEEPLRRRAFRQGAFSAADVEAAPAAYRVPRYYPFVLYDP